MRRHSRTTGALLNILPLLLSVAPADLAAAAESGRTVVIESARIVYDRAARVAHVTPCPTCASLVLEITPESRARRDGHLLPLDPDTDLGWVGDVMYRPSDRTLLWVQPYPREGDRQ